jgi:hypothetical protein
MSVVTAKTGRIDARRTIKTEMDISLRIRSSSSWDWDARENHEFTHEEITILSAEDISDNPPLTTMEKPSEC